jgi:HD-GYP domain-containing protein (c-di-GMP phosphodiesterase class II)
VARILGVVDSYDAMTSNRPYRKGMPHDKAAEILRKGSGQQWDSEVVETFLRAEDEVAVIRNSEYISHRKVRIKGSVYGEINEE